MPRIPPKKLLLAILLGLFPLTLCISIPIVNQNGKPPEVLFIDLENLRNLPKLSAKIGKSWDEKPMLFIETSNFELLDSCSITAVDTDLVGHIHIVKDNKKIGTAYSNVFPLSLLEKGQHTLTLSLHGPDHRAYVTKDGMITTRVEVNVN